MIGLVTEGEGKSHCKVGTLWVRQLSVASFPVTNLSDTSAGGQRLESSMTSFSNFLFINFLVINFLIINLLFINFLFINRETVTLSIPKSPELAHLLFLHSALLALPVALDHHSGDRPITSVACSCIEQFKKRKVVLLRLS